MVCAETGCTANANPLASVVTTNSLLVNEVFASSAVRSSNIVAYLLVTGVLSVYVILGRLSKRSFAFQTPQPIRAGLAPSAARPEADSQSRMQVPTRPRRSPPARAE